MRRQSRGGFTMKRVTLIICYFCAALPLFCVVVALSPHARAQKDDAALRFDLPRNARLRVENLRGSVTIEMWDENYVSLEFVAGTKREPPVRIERTPQLLTVSVLTGRSTRRARAVNLKLRVPPFARLQITTTKGEILMRGLPQSLAAQTTTGDVRLEVPADADALITAQSRQGQVVSTLNENERQPRRRTLQKRLGEGNKPVRLTSVSGQIMLAPSRPKITMTLRQQAANNHLPLLFRRQRRHLLRPLPRLRRRPKKLTKTT